MRQPILTALAVISALALGGLLYFWTSSDGGSTVLPDSGLTPSLEKEGKAATTELAPTAPQDAEGERSTATAESSSPSEAFAGRVRWPQGEVDAHCEVFLIDGKIEYADLAEALEALEPSSRILGRSAVAADGTFELPVREDLEDPHIALRGRYTYLPTSEPLRHGEVAPDLLPKLGAWIHGRVETEAGEGLDAEVALRFDSGQFTPAGLSDQALEIQVYARDGELSIEAVPADLEYALHAKGDSHANRIERLGEVERGQDLSVTLILDTGAHVQGRVVDVDGEAIEGAKVNALVAGRYFGFDDHEVREDESGADGAFELRNLPAGGVMLRASGSGHLESSKAKLDLVLDETRTGIVLTMKKGESLAGQILWSDGSPAAGVDVVADFDQGFLPGPSGMGALSGAHGEARSGDDGRFVLRGLGQGPFVVQAEAPAPEAGADAPKETWMRARRDAVRPDAGDLVLTLTPPLGLRGKVLAPEGAPLPQFEILASRITEGSMGSVGLDTLSETFDDADGAFFMPSMIDGTWHIYMRASGWTSLDPVVIQIAGEDAEAEIPVVRTSTVRGRVVSNDGLPVSDATVLVDDGQPEWMSAMSAAPPTARTRSLEDGAFELEDVPPGDVGLRAVADGHCRSEASPLSIEPGTVVEDVVLTLTTGGTLTGQAYSKSGEAARNQLVTVNSMATFRNVVQSTQPDGSFRFENLDPGTWQVIVMDGSADWSESEGGDMSGMMNSMQLTQADVIAGETTHVVIGAPPADPVLLHGRVTQGGEPYIGAVMSFYPSGEKLYERLRFTTVDKDGRYELVVDGPGDYVVYVQLVPGGVAQQQTIEYLREVPVGVTEHEIDIAIPLGRLSGRVRGPEGAAADGARVTLTVDGGSRSDQLFGGQYVEMATEPDGTFDINGLRPGTYRLSVGGALLFNGTGSELARVTRTGIRLEKDEWIQGLDFKLGPPGVIEAQVTGSDGQPISGAFVFVRDSAGNIMEPFSLATTDGAGKVRAGGLAPGDYTLVARKADQASEESSPIRVASGEKAKAKLHLDEGVILWIQLTGKKEGEDLQASVWVRDSEGRELTGMFSMEDLQNLYMKGGFSATEHRIGPLPPGRYRVEGTTSDGRSASKPVTLRAGDGERKLKLRLD